MCVCVCVAAPRVLDCIVRQPCFAIKRCDEAQGCEHGHPRLRRESIAGGQWKGGISSDVLTNPDIDAVTVKLHDMLLDVLQMTPRPTKLLLVKASAIAWKLEPHDADFFGARVMSVFKHCRNKMKQAVNYKRCPEHFRIVARALSKGSVGDKLKQQAKRKLQEHQSSASTPRKRKLRKRSSHSPKHEGKDDPEVRRGISSLSCIVRCQIYVQIGSPMCMHPPNIGVQMCNAEPNIAHVACTARDPP